MELPESEVVRGRKAARVEEGKSIPMAQSPRHPDLR